MKYPNRAVMLLLAGLMLFWTQPLPASEAANKTVLLKVHVPFAGG